MSNVNGFDYFNQRKLMLRKFFFSILTLVVILFVLFVSTRAVLTTKDAVEQVPSNNKQAVVNFYSDPFAYCAAIGTIDMPDTRYVGSAVSDQVIRGYQTATGLDISNENIGFFRDATVWRCMDSQVYVCNFGANLPCDSKANDDTKPSLAMIRFCSENPKSDIIPLSVMGHNTIFSWRCDKNFPRLVEQIVKIDTAGYIADIWYLIQPNSPTKP